MAVVLAYLLKSRVQSQASHEIPPQASPAFSHILHLMFLLRQPRIRLLISWKPMMSPYGTATLRGDTYSPHLCINFFFLHVVLCTSHWISSFFNIRSSHQFIKIILDYESVFQSAWQTAPNFILWKFYTRVLSFNIKTVNWNIAWMLAVNIITWQFEKAVYDFSIGKSTIHICPYSFM